MKRYGSVGVNAQTQTGTTALFHAVSKNHEEVCLILVFRMIPSKIVTALSQAQGDVNIPDHRSVTPLMRAAGTGREGMVSLLLLLDAKKNVRDTRGYTALWVTLKD